MTHLKYCLNDFFYILKKLIKLSNRKRIYVYNEKYYDGQHLMQLSPKLDAFRIYTCPEGTIIGLFQGAKGANALLDFKLKILLPGEHRRLVTPIHFYWVAELLFQIPKFKNEISELMEYYIAFYDNTTPFQTTNERDSYQPITVDFIVHKFSGIRLQHGISWEYIAILIEYFCKNEKLNPNARMFRELLVCIKDFANGNVHYLDVLEAAKPGYR